MSRRCPPFEAAASFRSCGRRASWSSRVHPIPSPWAGGLGVMAMRAVAASDRLIEGLLHALGCQVLEATQVTQGAGTGEARAAGKT